MSVSVKVLGRPGRRGTWRFGWGYWTGFGITKTFHISSQRLLWLWINYRSLYEFSYRFLDTWFLFCLFYCSTLIVKYVGLSVQFFFSRTVDERKNVTEDAKTSPVAWTESASSPESRDREKGGSVSKQMKERIGQTFSDHQNRPVRFLLYQWSQLVAAPDFPWCPRW